MTEIPTPTAEEPTAEEPTDEAASFDPPDASPSAESVSDPAAPDTAAEPICETAETASAAAESTDETSTTTTRRARRMNNPVVWREMHTRFDSLGTAAVIAIFILLLGLPAVAVYATTLDSDYSLLSLGQNGVTLFEVTLLLMLGLVMLVAPLQAAGAIAVERDRQTLMPMQISLLRPWQIALGKIRVATTFSMYLLLLAAPILAIAWSVGSVPVGRLIIGLLLLLVTIVFATTVTVFFSSLTKRSIAAAFMSYVVLGAIILGPTIGFLVYHTVDAQRGDDPVKAPKVLLATNPVMALATAVGDTTNANGEAVMFDEFGNVNGFDGPLSALKNSLITEQDGVLGNGTIMLEEGQEMIVGVNGVPATMVIDGPILFGPSGEPIMDPSGNPIPDNGLFEVSVDENDNVAVFDITTGEQVPLLGDPSTTEPPADGADPTSTTAPNVVVDVSVPGVGPEGGNPPARSIGGIPLWLEYIVFVTLISALAGWATTRRLRTPAATER